LRFRLLAEHLSAIDRREAVPGMVEEFSMTIEEVAHHLRPILSPGTLWKIVSARSI
jgi:hypothetical protein